MATPCFEGWNDPEHNSRGRCCCNCRHQREIVKHPWNAEPFKGRITERLGWGCTNPEIEVVVFSDKLHGCCELHDFPREAA